PDNHSCTIEITFTPSTNQPIPRSVSITDNAAGHPHLHSLPTRRSSDLATVSPTALQFNNQTVGTTSSAQQVTVKNNGNENLNVRDRKTTRLNSRHSHSSNATPNTRRTINVTFSPTQTGDRPGTLTITDN